MPDAYALNSHLLDGIVERVVPPFTPSKLEGDAVFAYGADSAAVPNGPAVLDCPTDCYAEPLAEAKPERTSRWLV